MVNTFRARKFAALFVLILTGCGDRAPTPAQSQAKTDNKIPDQVQAALEHGENFELLSLDPKHRDDDAPWEFYRRKVIGKTPIKDPATRSRLLAALNTGVRECEKDGALKCFEPRHAIRVQHNGKTYYLAICFGCRAVSVFVDNSRYDDIGFTTTHSPEPAFDEVLKAANLPLAEKATLEDPLIPQP